MKWKRQHALPRVHVPRRARCAAASSQWHCGWIDTHSAAQEARACKRDVARALNCALQSGVAA
jgi:hypothetical protein